MDLGKFSPYICFYFLGELLLECDYVGGRGTVVAHEWRCGRRSNVVQEAQMVEFAFMSLDRIRWARGLGKWPGL